MNSLWIGFKNIAKGYSSIFSSSSANSQNDDFRKQSMLLDLKMPYDDSDFQKKVDERFNNKNKSQKKF